MGAVHMLSKTMPFVMMTMLVMMMCTHVCREWIRSGRLSLVLPTNLFKHISQKVGDCSVICWVAIDGHPTHELLRINTRIHEDGSYRNNNDHWLAVGLDVNWKEVWSGRGRVSRR